MKNIIQSTSYEQLDPGQQQARYINRLQILKSWSQKTAPSPENIIHEYQPGQWYTQHDLRETARRVQNCAGSVLFDPETAKPIKGAWCQVPIACPVCAARTSSKRRATYWGDITQAARHYRHAYLITASITNGPNLAEKLAELKRAWARFRKMGQKRGMKTSRGQWAAVRAGCYSIEIKRAANNDWHPHIHAVVFTSKKLDFRIYDPQKRAEIIRKFRCFGQKPNKNDLLPAVKKYANFRGAKIPSSPIVENWITATLGESSDIHIAPIRQHVSIMRQINEVLKYNMKFQDNDLAQDFAEIMESKRGKRFFAALGAFYHKHQAPKIDRTEKAIAGRWDDKENVYRFAEIENPGPAIPGGVQTGIAKAVQAYMAAKRKAIKDLAQESDIDHLRQTLGDTIKRIIGAVYTNPIIEKSDNEFLTSQLTRSSRQPIAWGAF